MKKGAFKRLMGDTASILGVGGLYTNSQNLKSWENVQLVLEELLKDKRFSCKCYNFSNVEIDMKDAQLKGERVSFGIGEKGSHYLDFRPFESNVFIEPRLNIENDKCTISDDFIIYIFNCSTKFIRIGHTPMNIILYHERERIRPNKWHEYGMADKNGIFKYFSLSIIEAEENRASLFNPTNRSTDSPFKMKENLERTMSEQLIKSFAELPPIES